MGPRTTLKVAYTNIQSIRQKTDELQGLVLRSECSIWGFSETWLEERETYLYKLDNYNAFYSCRSGRKGGGEIKFVDFKKFKLLFKENIDSIGGVVT